MQNNDRDKLISRRRWALGRLGTNVEHNSGNGFAVAGTDQKTNDSRQSEGGLLILLQSIGRGVVVACDSISKQIESDMQAAQ